MRTHRTALSAAAALLLCAASFTAESQTSGPIKVGLMLPYSGTYAALGIAIENGFKLYVQEQGGKLGGREIQYFKVDDESEPSKATENVNKLIKRDNVDVLVGTVHSGVALAMANAAKANNTLLVIPNAGADAITGPLCAANIVRSSFSNWQPGYAMGVVAGGKGVKRAMTITWNYAAGAESTKGFTEGLEKTGGKVIKDIVARTGATIAAGGSGTLGKGYVLLNSTVNVDANVTAYFGRDAGVGAFYDQAALVGVTFTGTGTGMIGAGRWNVATLPLSLGDSSYVGWKSAGCTGLNLATNTTATQTSATIAGQATEYDTRDHIFNRVITVSGTTPVGYQAAASIWNTSALAAAWGAP